MGAQKLRSLRYGRERALIIVLVWATMPARAADWNEATDGDLSNNRLAPSSLTLAAGSNILSATMPGSDLDYLTTTVPSGHELSALTLMQYASTDGTAFIGVQAGNQVTTTSNAAVLLGYTHFGTGPGNVGANVLPAMGTGPGSMGFTPPLAAGNYSFWIQQASGVNVTYQFDFSVTALPPAELFGDYNDDNAVDAADYTVWQDNLGSAMGLPNDTTPAGVGAEDYEVWKANFGEVGMGTVAAVPETSSLAMTLVVGSALFSIARRRLRRFTCD